MKLSKDQIQFIDRYLIKNEVKFWDVRLELLDHIVSAVEDKITNDKISFKEALLQVHRGFGNQLIRGRISQHSDWTNGLYQANNGFKKFIRTKQKEIGKKYRRVYWSTFPKFFGSSPFVLEYLPLVLLISFIYQFNPKAAAISLIAICYALEFYKLFYTVFDKSGRRSLKVQLSTSLSGLFCSFSYFLLAGFASYYEGLIDKPYIYLIVTFLVLFPFLRHGLIVFRRMYKENKLQHQLLMS